MKLYYVPSSSCYVAISRIKYTGPDYFIAHLVWFSRPGMTLLNEEKNVKVPHNSKKTWLEVDSGGVEAEIE
jgi:hypothetical protein